MTTLNEAREAIYQRFSDEWGGATAFTLENEGFEAPRDGSPWVRVSVRNTYSEQACLGPVGQRRFTRFASVFVQVFQRPDAGTKDADALATASRAIFEGHSFGGLRCRAGTIKEVGVTDGWLGLLVEVPFDYEEIK